MILNVDPLNPGGAPSPTTMLGLGFHGIRFVSRPGVEQYSAQAQVAGLLSLAVVTNQSNGYVFGGPDVWQFGNEPDVSGTADYYADPSQYAADFNFYQATYPNLNWLGAGLASGDVTYWQGIVAAGGLNNAIGFAVHPYNKRWWEAQALLQHYQSITPNMGLWVTEWHRPDAEIPEFRAMLRRTVVANGWFCYSDAMVQGFGLTSTSQRFLILNS